MICDIYCGYAYSSRCDFTVFCFRKLKAFIVKLDGQLIRKSESSYSFLLINCPSNLTINVVSRAKKMRNEWLTMPTLSQEIFFIWFKAFTWLVLCCWRSWSWRSMIKAKGVANEISWNREKLTTCGTCLGKSFFQLVVT